MSVQDERGYDHSPPLARKEVSPTPSRYQWSFRGVSFDFYRLCEILGITHHAQAHALKKVIRAGRSIKPTTQDIDEAISALQRWKEMLEEEPVEGIPNRPPAPKRPENILIPASEI